MTMTKQQALDKIAELQAFVARFPERPLELGQVYRHKHSEEHYLVEIAHPVSFPPQYDLVCLEDGFKWSSGKGFDGDEDDFEYVGKFNELFTLKNKET